MPRGRKPGTPNPRIDWSDRQIEILRQNVGKMSARAIGQLIESECGIARSRGSVQHKMHELGLRSGYATYRWSPEHIEALLQQGNRLHVKNFSEQYGVPHKQIVRKARELGVTKDLRWRVWSPDKIELLRSLAPANTLQQIADAMGFDYKSVQLKALELKIAAVRAPRPTGITMRFTAPQFWRPDEIETLRSCHAQGMDYRSAAQKIGRSHHGVQKKAYEMGLYLERTPRYATPEAERRIRVRAPKSRPTTSRTAVPRTIKRVDSGPKLRKTEVRSSRIEWCCCGAPVSNWEQHHERVGYRGHEPRRIA